MSYLTKLKLNKTSKLTKVFKADKYDAFPDDIYSKPCKKSNMIVWAAQLNKFSNLTDDDLQIESNIIAIEKSFYQMILISCCLANGQLLGSAFDDDDIEQLACIEDHSALNEMFMAACKSNKIDKTLAKFFMDFLDGIYSVDFDLSKLDDTPEPVKKRGRPKAK